MSDEIKIELSEEAKATMARMAAAPEAMLAAVAGALQYENELTVSHIQSAYLSFPRDGEPSELGLRVQSNRLRQSAWASEPAVRGSQVESAIGDNVVYAAIHEFGGTIPARTVRPKHGKALRFQIGERVIFATKVELPEVEMPERGMFRRGIRDRMADYGKSVSRAVVGAMH